MVQTAYYRPTAAEISLDALESNIKAFRRSVPDGMKILASVKANAYGHGLIQIAREAQACGVDCLGVAFLDEALRLRGGGIMMPILVLGYVPPEALELARRHDITIALFREDVLQAASSLPADTSQKLKVHIKIDTGMGRLGKLADGSGSAEAFIERALRVPGLQVEGVFTHFAKADEADKTYTLLQYERFAAVVDYVRRHSLPIPILHSANTAAGMDTPELGGDMLRLGIGMYGLYPSAEVNRQAIAAAAGALPQIPDRPCEGSAARLGDQLRNPLRRGGADEDRHDSDRLCGRIQPPAERQGTGAPAGGRVPIVGTICMDQCMVELGAADALGPALWCLGRRSC